MVDQWSTAAEIAAAVASGRTSAASVVEERLARIAAIGPTLNAFTVVTAERAQVEAAEVDRRVARGEPAGPLAGVPFAVKNLFDVEGLPTLAGSRINRDRPPGARDAVLVRRMCDAGAVLVGTLHMGEYAYDFTGENAHDGPCRNPHDAARMTGGSSSGCGAATAAGLAPVTLGSDTNGSLRVPASLCGVFSLKPTYGRLPRTGTFPFVDSLDHLGPFARNVGDLARAYDALQDADHGDHACSAGAPDPVAHRLEIAPLPLRIGLPRGWLAQRAGPEARQAMETAAAALEAAGARLAGWDSDDAEAGRAAAYLITNAESAAFHLDRLRARASDFDPDTRDRFLAGALLPASWLAAAQRARRWWLEQMRDAFRSFDALIVPATPCSAPLAGARSLQIAGQEVPLRPNLGLLAQPFSCIGLPVVTAPVFGAGSLPIGVQIITPPWTEAAALSLARLIELAGVSAAHPPQPRLASHPRPGTSARQASPSRPAIDDMEKAN